MPEYWKRLYILFQSYRKALFPIFTLNEKMISEKVIMSVTYVLPVLTSKEICQSSNKFLLSEDMAVDYYSTILIFNSFSLCMRWKNHHLVCLLNTGTLLLWFLLLLKSRRKTAEISKILLYSEPCLCSLSLDRESW